MARPGTDYIEGDADPVVRRLLDAQLAREDSSATENAAIGCDPRALGLAVANKQVGEMAKESQGEPVSRETFCLAGRAVVALALNQTWVQELWRWESSRSTSSRTGPARCSLG